MNSTQLKSDSQNNQDQVNASGGELPQKQGGKNGNEKWDVVTDDYSIIEKGLTLFDAEVALSRCIGNGIEAFLSETKETPKKKRDQARKALIALSKVAKDQAAILAAKTGQVLSINQVLIFMYQQQTGCKTFRTFQEWKKEGFSVKKGEASFRVWAKPIKAKESKDDSENVDEATKFKFWPMCCLFNESQVEKTDQPPVAGNDNLEPSTVHELSSDNNASIQADLGNDETAVPSVFVNTDYLEQQEGRRERLENRAKKKRQESNDQYQRSRELVEHIPMGQPILVGHHSEAGHRRTLDKSWNAMGKSVALDDYANNLDKRAASVGTGGISSNDPDAIKKLKEKLSSLELSQETMKAANKAIKFGDDKALELLGFSPKTIAELKNGDSCGSVGFPSYSLANNGAEIRRTKKRIEDLVKLHSSTPLSFENDVLSFYVAEGRYQIKFFGGKPSEEVRSLLKSFAFKWSRYSSTWVRKATNNARYASEQLLSQLKVIGE